MEKRVQGFQGPGTQGFIQFLKQRPSSLDGIFDERESLTLNIFIPNHYTWSPRIKLHSSPQVIEPEVTFPEDGSEATISHQTSGLEDGLNTVVIEIVDENGNVTDSMQIFVAVHGWKRQRA